MDSLANYASDGDNSNNSDDAKTADDKGSAEGRASDANYDPVQMDMSEESNNNNSSGDSGNERAASPIASSVATPRHDASATSSEQRRDRADDEKRDRGSRDRGRRSSAERRRDEPPKRRRSRSSSRRRDDERRRKEERRSEERDHHHHRDERKERKDRERRRDRDRERRRDDRKERHREERGHREKERPRSRSRSRSRERPAPAFRPLSYREEKGRNKLAQLEKLGIELKPPEGEPTTIGPPNSAEPNFYNPLATATQGKYAEQIQKRKLLWANKAKSEEGKAASATSANTWVGTTFTHDQDGKVTAKFKRLMGIKDDLPAPSSAAKPDILKKQEEMFSNMEQQYEVARATTHTQRGVGLGYATGGYQFPR